MGAVHTKHQNGYVAGSTSLPARQPLEYSSPLKNSAMLNEEVMIDPRSPTSKRSPVLASRASALAYKERLRRRYNPTSSAVDPRSPGPNRTPTSQTVSAPILATPPPFNLSMSACVVPHDPRSPAMFRTPLRMNEEDPRSPSVFRTPALKAEDPRSPSALRTPLSLTQDEPALVDDVVVVEKVINEAITRAVEDGEVTVVEEKKQVEAVVLEESGVMSSVARKSVTEVFNSPSDLSPLRPLSLSMALAMSPVQSPSLARRKVKELSPLRKTFSAPSTDENATAASPKSKTQQLAQNRTPLSPLSRNARCVPTSVQPIKFRMDPGILG